MPQSVKLSYLYCFFTSHHEPQQQLERWIILLFSLVSLQNWTIWMISESVWGRWLHLPSWYVITDWGHLKSNNTSVWLDFFVIIDQPEMHLQLLNSLHTRHVFFHPPPSAPLWATNPWLLLALRTSVMHIEMSYRLRDLCILHFCWFSEGCVEYYALELKCF